MKKVKREKLNNSELSAFFENMGMMLKAGITTEEGIDLLIKDAAYEKDDISVKVMEDIHESMTGGDSFASAVKGTGAFPEYSVSMMETAEFTGRLEDVFFHLATYYRDEESISRTLASTIKYPVVLLSMIILVLLVMLFMVFPAFREVYQSMAGSLLDSSYKYINVSIIVCVVLLAVLIAMIIALVTGVAMWKKDRNKVRKMLSRSKGFLKLFEGFGLYRFTTCFEMLLSSGEMQNDAVKKSIDVAEAETLEERLRKCSSLMDEGKSFSQAAYDVSLYDSMTNRILIPAERSGNLDGILTKVSSELKEKNENALSRISDTIEPVLTGVLLIFVGIMLVMIMLPLIGMMNSIG